MNIDKFIIVAKDILMKNKKADGFEFRDLWSKVGKELKLSTEESQKLIGQFYNELLENANFVLLENKNWTHRDLITYEKYNELSKSLFSAVTDDVNEEEYIKHMSKNEIKELNKSLEKENSDDDSIESRGLPTEELNIDELLDDESDDLDGDK